MRDRFREREGYKRGPLTGPNPTDRGKLGSKIHLITDRNASRCHSGSQGPTSTTVRAFSRSCAAFHPSAPDGVRAAGGLENYTVTRATTTTTCVDGSVAAASSGLVAIAG